MGQQQCTNPSNYHVLLDGKSVVDQRTDEQMVFLINLPLITHCCHIGWVSIIDKAVTLMMKLKIKKFLK